jgi:hypothetical protein
MVSRSVEVIFGNKFLDIIFVLILTIFVLILTIFVLILTSVIVVFE